MSNFCVYLYFFNSSLINNVFPELNNCALIRELHIYGQLIHHLDDNIGEGVQHRGLGKALINRAIETARIYNIEKLSVISGVGVRNYYLKMGFKFINTYIDKDGNIVKANGNFLIIDTTTKINYYLIMSIIVVFIAIIFLFFV